MRVDIVISLFLCYNIYRHNIHTIAQKEVCVFISLEFLVIMTGVLGLGSRSAYQLLFDHESLTVRAVRIVIGFAAVVGGATITQMHL